MPRKPSPSDVSAAEWQQLTPLIPPAKSGGRHRTVDMQEMLNGLFSVNRTGWSWRALPHDLPPWSPVDHYVRLWRQDGTWERIQSPLREQVRVQAGREPTPSAAILERQSVRTTEKGGVGVTTQARSARAANALS